MFSQSKYHNLLRGLDMGGLLDSLGKNKGIFDMLVRALHTIGSSVRKI